METEELYSINISPLVTAPFATQWSPDNQISIITDRGVHIFVSHALLYSVQYWISQNPTTKKKEISFGNTSLFFILQELEPTPMSPNSTIRFARSFINTPDSLPAYIFTDEITPLIWHMQPEKIYSLLMQEMITPKLDGASDRLLRIVKVAWSPKNLISPDQCVLAIITAAGTVELSHKVRNEWYSICDVSSLWLDIVQNEIKSSLDKCKKSRDPYSTITESMRQLQACSVTWSKLFTMEETCFAYFSVTYCSGDISIWQIRRITKFSESLQPMLVGRIDSNVSIRINVLCWLAIDTDEHLLVMGCIDGRIRAIKLTRRDNKLQAGSMEQYVDPDDVAIDHLHVISQDNKSQSDFKVLAVKSFFLLLLRIDSEGVLMNMRYLQIQGFNITGTCSTLGTLQLL